MTFHEGNAVGPYEIRERIGVGGMGEVYRAIDRRLNRTVAIKVIPAAMARDAARRERFRREARTISSLNHPHICTIYDVGQDNGIDYLVMEFLEGETLAARLARSHDSPLSLAEALRYAIDIGDALDQAHRRGVVHRDVKPGNIMLTAGGATLLDFGLAKPCLTGLTQPSDDRSSLGDDQSSLTIDGTLVGTLAYMSPEQLEGKEADPASDLFAFGAVLFEMVSGRPAFEAPNGARMVAAVLERTLPPASAIRGEVTPALDRLIARCLAKNPDERWQTARDLLSELKWIAEPPSHPGTAVVRATRRLRPHVWIWPAAAALAVLGVAPFVWSAKPTPIDAIAILPLANHTGDPELDYLTDGITETLINVLSQVPDLKVMSSTAVARYKGRQVDAREVGKELGVKALVIGKVGKHEDVLSISIEMVDAHDNRRIWGQRYNRPLAGILAVQEDISKEVSGNLRMTLTGDADAALAKRFTRSPEAHELYLRGRSYWNKRLPRDLIRSLQYFEQAIGKDPEYALAYAGLADAYNLLGSVGYDVFPPSEVIPKASLAAAQALRLDDSLAEAHAAMGFVRRFEFDHVRAGLEHRRSVALNPNYVTGRQWLASHLWTQGRFDEALVQLQQAQTLEPMSPLISLNMGRHYYFARDFDRAIEHFAETLRLDPHSFIAGQLMAMAYVENKMVGSALKQLVKSPAPPGPFLSVLGYVHAVNGDRATAHHVIAEMEALSKKDQYIPPYAFALVYIGLGMNDAAFAKLEDARLEHSGYLHFLSVEPNMDRLRLDPRFATLLRRVGLSEVRSVKVAARARAS